VTVDDARRFALSLPDAAEAPHFEMSSFRVRGRIFATVPPDGEHLHVFVDEHAARAVVAMDRAAYEELWWGKRRAGVRVHLPVADAEVVRDMLEESWRRKAPATLIRILETGHPGRTPEGEGA
jgi:hypothetical protein